MFVCGSHAFARPLYVGALLENSSFGLAEYGLSYSVWFLDIFSA